MEPLRICPDCGAELPADAPPGLCPNCLLGAALPAADVTVTYEPSPVPGPNAAGVLAGLAETLGGVPRVLLRATDQESGPTPVERTDSSALPPPADRPGKYQLFGEIARGGMGAVLKARDPDLGRELALKVLLEQHKDQPELVRRFLEEAQIGGQLQHPGIVPIYELGAFADRRPFFAMKLVRGRTLASLLEERGTPGHDLPRFLSIFEQIAQTVAYAHARGVIHRDLKPTNVMVGAFGEVQVMDWGLAKVLPRGGAADGAVPGEPEPTETVVATARGDSDHSRAGSVMGTPAYMAPEQARGEVEAIDERADVFALGSILCEVLTGRPAFTGRTSGEIQRQAARGATADALARLDGCGAEAELVAVARRCLAAERDDRPRDAGEVARATTAYLGGMQQRLRAAELARAAEAARAEAAQATAAAAEARAAAERRARRLTAGLAAAVLGLVAIGGGGRPT
jgi:serine/threonine-protein kinase